MYNLKNHGLIDHMTMSFYLRESTGNSSSIKFGSYDGEGINPGSTLEIYRTKGLDKWSL